MKSRSRFMESWKQCMSMKNQSLDQLRDPLHRRYPRESALIVSAQYLPSGQNFPLDNKSSNLGDPTIKIMNDESNMLLAKVNTLFMSR